MATPAAKFNFPTSAATPKPLIIQCPSCSTKFALSSEAVSGSSTQKFHCSRCDSIFSQEIELKQEVAPLHQEPVFEELPPPPPPPLPPLAQTSLTFDEPLAADAFDFSFDEDDEKIYTRFDTGFGDNEQSEISVAKFDDEPMGYGSLVREQVVLHDPLAAAAPSFMQRIKIPAKHKPLMYVLAPCAVFLCFALCVAILSSTAPLLVASAANLIAAEKTTIGPRDIFVKNTKVKRIALDSGEMVTQITGTAVNKSADTLRDITVEASVYDKASKQVGANKTLVSSNIGKSRIQSLTPEMILDLQMTSSARSFSVKAGQEAPFTAVVVEAPSKNGGPKFFTVRVFSATKR
jgi:predicted Zn finger-like uncharacterized protein